MRAFVAITLPPALRSALVTVQSGLNVGRPVPEDNLHLTLAFLDDVADEALDALHQDLSAWRPPAPDVAVSGLDLFGTRHPRLLFANVTPTPDLKHLHDKVLTAARNAGISLKRERFRPHITLARFRHGMGPADQARLGQFLQTHGAVTLPPVRPLAFALYASTLRPDGAVHELLAEYPLQQQT